MTAGSPGCWPFNTRLAVVPEPLVVYRIHAQQQLGVGERSRAQRLKRIRATERERFARVADQFSDPRRRTGEIAAPNLELLRSIDRRILLLRQRSQLPHSLIIRIFWVFVHTRELRRFARGWCSMRKDVLLS